MIFALTQYNTYLPLFTDYIILTSGSFDYLTGSTEGAMEKMSMINWVMNVFQFLTIAFVYARGRINKDEGVILILTLLAIIINSTAFFVPEVHRLSMYFVFFQFFTIAIVLSQLKTISKPYYCISYIVYTGWIFWNIYKLLMPVPTDHSEYKTVLMLLLN